MINDDDRKALIAYRMAQATDTVDLAKFLIENNKLTVAVNRIYYGMFYALTALSLKYQFETSKHSQLISWFNKEFIASGKVDAKSGKALRNAYQYRTRGDYDAFVKFSSEEVNSMLGEMKDFINVVRNLIG